MSSEHHDVRIICIDLCVSDVYTFCVDKIRPSCYSPRSKCMPLGAIRGGGV
jgi:hypothetical protein